MKRRVPEQWAHEVERVSVRAQSQDHPPQPWGSGQAAQEHLR